MAVETTSAQTQQSLQQPGPISRSAFYPNSTVTPDQLGVPVQQQYQPANVAGLGVGQMGMPAIPTTVAQNGMYTSGSPQQNTSGASDFSLDDEPQAADQHQKTGNSQRSNGKLHARDTKTKRNPKQQMQNKQAQQRYRWVFTPNCVHLLYCTGYSTLRKLKWLVAVIRERRKQKFVEMEQAIDALAAQTKDMNSLQSQHQRLQVMPALPACTQRGFLYCCTRPQCYA